MNTQAIMNQLEAIIKSAGALIAQEAGAIVESIQGEWTYAHPIGIIGGTPQNIGDIRRIVHMP